MPTLRRLRKTALNLLKPLRYAFPRVSFSAYSADVDLSEITSLYVFAVDSTGRLVGGYEGTVARDTFALQARIPSVKHFFEFCLTAGSVVFSSAAVRGAWHHYIAQHIGLRWLATCGVRML